MVTAVAWLASSLFILTKGSLMNQIGVETLDIDIVSILMACLLVSRGRRGAAVFAVGQGILMDVFSAGWPGLFWFLYMAVFLWMRLGTGFFDPHSMRGIFLLVSTGVLLKDLMVMGLLYVFSLQVVMVSSAFSTLAVSALLSGLLAPVLALALQGLSKVSATEAEDAG